MIILENVSKTFHDKTVLQKTDLTVESETITGFVGRNGSGKTVLLKLICGLMLPTTGTVTVDGVQVGRDRDFAPDAGVLIETPSFINYESGLRNLRALAAIRRKISVEQVKDAICLVGLDPEDKKRVGKYSLGMRQRLRIAQAVADHPRRADERPGQRGRRGNARPLLEPARRGQDDPARIALRRGRRSAL